MSSNDQRGSVSGSNISAGSWFASALLGAVAGGCLLAFVPAPFDLTPELAAVDQYSPKDLQIEAAAQTNRVIWQNGVTMAVLAGVAWGIVQAAFLVFAGPKAGGKLILLGLVVGALVGAAVGQLGLTLRSLLNSEAAVANIQDPLYRDSLFFLSLSLVFAVIPATIYLVCKSSPGLQQAIAILLAAGLAGAIVPMAVSMFPSLATNVFPPSGLGLAGTWFGILGVLIGAAPGLIGSKPKTNAGGDAGEGKVDSNVQPATGNAG